MKVSWIDMGYEVKMKRSGEDSVIIDIDQDGFNVREAANIRHPTNTAAVLKQVIRVMEMESFEEMEIKAV